MNINLLIKGFVSGLIIGIPFGPVGILCMRNALRSSRINGLSGGLGIAAANAVYTWAIGFGLTFIYKFLFDYLVWFHIMGGIIFCFPKGNSI